MIDTDTATGLMYMILDGACPNGGVEEDGWASYVIETHCVAWRVSARKQDGRWDIRKITSEDC
jgi:hypothetical protein